MPIVTMPNGDRVRFPDDMPKDQIQAKIRSKFPEETRRGWDVATGAVTDFGRGLAKGVGNLAEELPTLGTPHVSELDPNAKQFLSSPNATAAESIGSFAGENAPFLIGGPEAAIGKGVARAIPFAGKMAGPIGEFAGRSLWGGAAGAAQPVKEGESRLTNAAGGALTAGVLSPRIAGATAGAAGAAGAGLGVEELVRRFGWGPVIGALSALGVGASHFGLGGLAHKAYKAARYPAQVLTNAIPAGVAGAAGGRAAESGQETYDANQSGSAQGQ